MKRKSVPMAVPAASLKKGALLLIDYADKLEADIQSKQEELSEILGIIAMAIGAASFEHPSKGEMTVMSRGKTNFWRKKPSGVRGHVK